MDPQISGYDEAEFARGGCTTTGRLRRRSTRSRPARTVHRRDSDPDDRTPNWAARRARTARWVYSGRALAGDLRAPRARPRGPMAAASAPPAKDRHRDADRLRTAAAAVTWLRDEQCSVLLVEQETASRIVLNVGDGRFPRSRDLPRRHTALDLLPQHSDDPARMSNGSLSCSYSYGGSRQRKRSGPAARNAAISATPVSTGRNRRAIEDT